MHAISDVMMMRVESLYGGGDTDISILDPLYGYNECYVLFCQWRK